MVVDVIVPAHNEEHSVASVVSALVASRSFRRVVVVDDGSTDNTARLAQGAGAEVLRLSPNHGKGQAMLAAYSELRKGAPDRVAFFDADLLGLRPEHARVLCAASEHYDMVCGQRDYGPVANALSHLLPLMTGERVLKPWILDRLPADCWSGYRIEMAMNSVCSHYGGHIRVVPMPGVRILMKDAKAGGSFAKATSSNIDMIGQMLEAKAAMHVSGCRRCD